MDSHIRATLTARQAAQYIGVSYWLILELVKRHELPGIRAGKRILFRRDSLDCWMERREKETLNL